MANRESPKAIERRLSEDLTVPFLAPDEKFIFKMGVRNQFFQTLPSRDSRLLPSETDDESNQLDISQAIHLLKQDTICVNSEDEIFFAAVRWLEHDWTSREEYVMEIMKTNEFIRKLGTNIQLRSIMWDAFGNAESDITVEDFSQRDKDLLLGKYTERYWIYSLGVPHHHDVRCPQYRQLTYEAFKYFLICLQNYSVHFMDGLKYVPCKHGNTYRCYKDILFSFNETQCFSSPRIHSMMR